METATLHSLVTVERICASAQFKTNVERVSAIAVALRCSESEAETLLDLRSQIVAEVK